MDIKTMPKRTAAELFAYLAENEGFESLESLGGSITVDETRALLREVAVFLHQASALEAANPAWAKNPHLSRKAKQLISCLSATEETALKKAFDIPE